MTQRTTCRSVTPIALLFFSASIALAQSSTSVPMRGVPAYNTWEVAQQVGSSKHKLIVVTRDQPERRQSCHVQSFTREKLVCSRAFGDARTYLPGQVAALILPGDDAERIEVLLMLNGESAAAIWGTVVLAATCPACAVATGVVAAVLLCAAGAISFGDGQPERLLYLAPGQQLSAKFRYVEPLAE